MANNEYSVIVQGLDKVDLLALERELPEASLDLNVIGDDEHRYGEPGTIIAIALIGNLVLPVVLVWLTRYRRSFEIKEEEHVQLPNGGKSTRTLTVIAKESGPPSPETLEKLAKFKGVSLEQLKQLLGAS